MLLGDGDPEWGQLWDFFKGIEIVSPTLDHGKINGRRFNVKREASGVIFIADNLLPKNDPISSPPIVARAGIGAKTLYVTFQPSSPSPNVFTLKDS